MPHIEISCFPGRTEEQKNICAGRIADVIAEELGCKRSSVSVAIKEVPEEDWKEQVWDAKIVPDGDKLYKKPGYSCDEE